MAPSSAALTEPLLLARPRRASSTLYVAACALVCLVAACALVIVFTTDTSRLRLQATEEVAPALEALWETSAHGNRLQQIDSLPVDTATPATVTLTVWPDDEHQTILGFGGAITQASGVVWRRLSKPLQKRVVDLFFGEDGLRASLARVPIGSCDFAESSYSADDVNKATVSLKWTK
jgi:hypothetical protein